MRLLPRISCTRKLEWDCLHRIPAHEGKCRAFHGHRYVAEITCEAPALDNAGRVIDFGLIKSLVGAWIDEHWDHTAILMSTDDDPATLAIITSNKAYGRPVYLMNRAPSAENIAQELASIASSLLSNWPLSVIEVRVWETPSTCATYEVFD